MLANITFVSYLSAAAGYLFLSALLLLRWRSRTLAIATIVATVVTGLWALTIALSALLDVRTLGLIRAVEMIRNICWMFVILSIYGARLRHTDSALGGRRWLPWYVAGSIVAVVVLLVAPLIQNVYALPESYARTAVYCVWLSISISGMLVLENLYRNSTRTQRWWTKYLVIGLGVIFLYDFLMYAGALMMQQLDPLLAGSRGFVVALTVPFIGVAVARSRRRRGAGSMPQHVVFHTLTLLSTGIYLMIMAVVAVFLSSFSDSWSGVLELTFFAAAGLFLLALLLSESTRARVNVWLSKNFFSYKYDYRQEWLDFTGALEQAETDAPQGIIQAMARLTSSDAGVLFGDVKEGRARLVGEWQYSFESGAGDFSEFHNWLRNSGWVIDLAEWRQRPNLYQGLEMPPTLARLEANWLVIPLMFGEELEGILLLRRVEPFAPLNWEDRDLLKVAARQAASQLAQYMADQSLVELRQFEAFHRTSAYVIHDLKNILAEQSLIVSNAARHQGNQAFYDDVIETVEDSVSRMTRLMEQMRSGVRGGEGRDIELSALLQQALARVAKDAPEVRFVTHYEECWVNADPEQLATVFGHLLQNACDAVDKSGRVNLSVKRKAAEAVVTIEDNGTGMTPEFVKQRLFKLFDSTKGLTGMGIGAYESRELIRTLGGDITVSSEPGVGTVFRIMLPCEAPEKTITPVVEEAAIG